MKRVIQKEIVNELSKKILSGEVTKDTVIVVENYGEGGLVFQNKKEKRKAVKG